MNDRTDLTFKKADLHMHTPESDCYSDKSVSLEQIVDAALAAGLEVIAITDHNTFAAINGIRKIAEKKGLTVLPGVELTTKCGHIIALFDNDSSLERLEEFLDYIGVNQEGRGNGTANIGDDIEEVLQKIDERGGIAIAAHIERWPSGFLETSESRQVKMGIHASQYLSALEITVPQNKQLWNTGQVRDYPKKYACVQGSDAHALKDISRRPVYIQMDGVSLEALRLAFLDYKTNIIFPDELLLIEQKAAVSKTDESS
ncbi:PHP domain-containing protein [Chloroflexota bacterium]